MPYELRDARPDPPLDLDVLGHGSSTPARLTVLSGSLVIAPPASAVRVMRPAGYSTAEPFGAYVPTRNR